MIRSGIVPIDQLCGGLRPRRPYLLTGGAGTVRGTVVGVLIIRILPNIFNLLALQPAWQQVARGAVLLLVVLLQLVVVPGAPLGGLRLPGARSRSSQAAQAR